MSVLLNEHQQWLDNGIPIVNGLVFVGTNGNDPSVGYPDLPTNLITIYSDRALTTPIDNPQPTGSDGRTLNKVWIPDITYSVLVWDSDSVQKYISLDEGVQADEQVIMANVAELVATEGGYDGQVAILAGSTAIGLGGAGPLYWDSASIETENGFTIYKVTGVTTGRWKRLNLTSYPLPQVTAGGTVNAITATFPETLVLIDGLELRVRAAGANDSATVTFSPNGLTAKNVRKNGNRALVTGDIEDAGHELRFVYNLANDVWELLNPARPDCVVEHEVTGAAVTSIDFTGLDSSIDKSYRIEFELNLVTSSTNIYIYANNDTTATNYYSQNLQGNGASPTAVRSNNPAIAGGNAGAYHLDIKATTPNGWLSIICATARELDGITPVNQYYVVSKTASITDITQLTLTSSVASGIGIGSKVRIYRG